MDFGTLLHVAKQNSENGKTSGGKYYSTKFSAPKKESKEKRLSDNIRKFLEKKEQEEREKARLEKRKRDELLAMRDEKAKNKIKKMLKVIKSANKSVLEDAIDTENTAVTMHGPEQPDEDDYGYVSQEASAFYAKYMDKVKTVTDDKKFAPSRPTSKSDLSGTKDRVRAAIMREQEELSNPRLKKQLQSQTSSQSQSCSEFYKPEQVKSSSSLSSFTEKTSHRRKNLYDPAAEREDEERKRKEEEERRRKHRKAPPPAMDFQQLLKLAEQKQHEPVEVVVETKKEPERLLTKKEKLELEERRAHIENKDKKKRLSHDAQPPSAPNKMLPNGKIPKLNGSSDPKRSSEKPSKPTLNSSSSSSPRDNFKKPSNHTSSSMNNGYSSTNKAPSQSSQMKQKPLDSKSSSLVQSKLKASGQLGLTSGKQSSSTSSTQNSSNKASLNKPSAVAQLSSARPSSGLNGAKRPDMKSVPVRKDTLLKDNAMRRPDTGRANGDMNGKPKRPSDIPERTRQFPPPDVMRNRKPEKKPMKRRIVDDDSEYDSELDDFIDDGPEEDQNYSAHIKEIFGYDRSRFRDEDDDDAGMESSFAQQMREEFISKKIGLLEDLEDMRKEEEEKRRKSLKKKKLN